MIYSNNKVPSCMSKSTIWNAPYCNNRFSKVYSKVFSYCTLKEGIFETAKHVSSVKGKFKTKTIGNKLK